MTLFSSLASLRPWQALREYTRHHGFWTPGVKAMRNLSLRAKTLICLGMSLLVVAIPLQESVSHRWHAWQDIRHAEHGLEQVSALRAMGLATGLLHDALVLAHSGGLAPPLAPPLAPLMADEAARFAQLQQLIAEPHTAPPIKRAMASVVDSRSALLDRLKVQDKDPRSTTSMDALAVYRDQLQTMRMVVNADASIAMDQDASVRELRLAISDKMAHIQTVLRDLQRMGAQLYQGPQSPEFVQRYLSTAISARLLLEQAKRHLEANGQLQSQPDSGSAAALASLRQFTQTAEQVALAAATSTGLPDASATTVVSAEAYQRQAAAAVTHNRALLHSGLTQLEQHIADRHRAFTHGLARDAILLILTLGLSTYLTHCAYLVVNGGLQTLCKNLDALGQGKLDIRAHGWGRDEIGQALGSLGASAHQFSQLLEAVSRGVASVSYASKEVATGNQGLAGRTQDIRTAINHVGDKTRTLSTAMDECGEKVNLAAEHVRGMRADAERSQKAMSGLRENMRSLQSRSREIAQVVGLVETVAYQTKLLSLNASVEAARAGEAGRGFAIVAQEVRALASRSEEAARKIHTIVNSSINVIEDGTIMTARVSEAVEHTGTAILAVNQIISDVVRLTHAGVSESQEVLGIARHVETSAEGNARLVDQLSNASAALRSQGDSLKHSVRHFVFG